MRRVVFLDVDGVLNCADTEEMLAGADGEVLGLDDRLVQRLLELVMRSKAVVVVTSAWRLSAERRAYLKSRIPYADVTVDLGMGRHSGRGHEIQHWLDSHPGTTRYAIVDDEEDVLPEQLEHCFFTDFNSGLTADIVEAVVSHLKRPSPVIARQLSVPLRTAHRAMAGLTPAQRCPNPEHPDSEGVPKTMITFRGRYAFLSNFSRHPVVLDDEVWPTVEHAFQAAKTTDADWRRRIQEAKTPMTAKRRGLGAPLRADWELVKRDVMRAALESKFAPGTELAERLLATGDRELVELNHWHDVTWGKCSCEEHEGGGENWNGLMLMEIRAQLRRDAP